MANALVEALEAAMLEARSLDAPLKERLAMIGDRVRALSTDFAEAVDRLVARQLQAGAGNAAPRPGEQMPAFALPDEAGRLLTLDGLLAVGPVAIFFNRGHWCPYCRLHAQAMAEAQADMTALGGQLVAIVPERRQFAQALKAESAATYPILTDMDNGYALSLNLAIWVGTEMEAMMTAAGWEIPKFQGNDSWIMPVPATFVIRQDGVIATRYIDPDYRQRMNVNDLLAAIRSLTTANAAA